MLTTALQQNLDGDEDMTTRDFSESVKTELKSLIDTHDRERNGWWIFSQIVDSLSDLWISDDIASYGTNIAKYHNNIIDKKNMDSAQLDKIWDAVYQTDTTFDADVKAILDQAKQLASLFSAQAEVIDPAPADGTMMPFLISEVDYLSRVAAVRAQGDSWKGACIAAYNGRYAQYLSEHPEALQEIYEIYRYEMLHSEYVDQTDTFLSLLDTSDIIAIKTMIYTSEEPQRTLCLRFLDQFTITGTTASGVFTAATNSLAFDVSKDRTNQRGDYYTFFHELGHAIDYYYGQEQGVGSTHFFTDTFVINNQTLFIVNGADVQAGLLLETRTLLSGDAYSNFTQAQRNTMATNVVNNLMAQNRSFNSLSTAEQTLQRDLQIVYRGTIFNGADNESASDIYGGVTNNVIVGSYGHFDQTPPYWFDQNLNRTRETNRECFAEYFGRIMTNDPESTNGLNSIATLLPGSKSFLDQALSEMN